MAKEWILNSATNRFQLNFSRNVGKVAEEIRKCSPKTLEDWEKYYYQNVRPKEHLIELGRKLYTKITEVLQAEIESVTEQDCIDFIINLVIKRTFDGYITEKQTIYGQLQDILGVKIEPAPDEWDRLYNVDFFIKVKDKFIGLQIKPAGGVSHITQIYQERTQQAETHKKFSTKYGGKVFYVISIKDGDKKKIHNKEVIEEIKAEIKRLQSD
ncbi:MAG: MjaI family restriction endonuclease [Candidatus Aenigmatarchaeota archaeon]